MITLIPPDMPVFDFDERLDWSQGVVTNAHYPRLVPSNMPRAALVLAGELLEHVSGPSKVNVLYLPSGACTLSSVVVTCGSLRCHLHVCGTASGYVAPVVFRKVLEAIHDRNVAVCRDTRLATAAWMLASWFTLDYLEGDAHGRAA